MRETTNQHTIPQEKESLFGRLKSFFSKLKEEFRRFSEEEWEGTTTKEHPISEVREVAKGVTPEFQEEANEIVSQISAIDTQLEDQIERASQLGSTTGGVVYREVDGRREMYYLKFRKGESSERQKEEEHLKAEYLAASMYRRFGIKVPELDITRGSDERIILVSKFVSSEEHPQIYGNPLENPDLKDGFIMDVLLGNYDIYLNPGNLISTDEGTYRVDNGSSFMWKARGSRKKNQEGLYDSYTENPQTELDLYRDMEHPNWVDKKGNRWSPYFSVNITEKEISEQVTRMQEIFTDEVIDEMLDSAEFTSENRQEIRRLLIQRRDWLIERYTRKEESSELGNNILDELIKDNEDLSSNEIKHIKSHRFYKEFSVLPPEDAKKLEEQILKEFQKIVGEEFEITPEIKYNIYEIILSFENYSDINNISKDFFEFSKLIDDSHGGLTIFLLNILSPNELREITENKDSENIKIKEFSEISYSLPGNDFLKNQNLEFEDRRNIYQNIRKIYEIIKFTKDEGEEIDFRNIYEIIFTIPGIESVLKKDNIEGLNEIVSLILKLEKNKIKQILKSENYINPENSSDEKYLIEKIRRAEEISTLIGENKRIQEFIVKMVTNSKTNFELNPDNYKFLSILSTEANEEGYYSYMYDKVDLMVRYINDETDLIKILKEVEHSNDLYDICKLLQLESKNNKDLKLDEILLFIRNIYKSNSGYMGPIVDRIKSIENLLLANKLVSEGVSIPELWVTFKYMDEKIIENYQDYEKNKRIINAFKNRVKEKIENFSTLYFDNINYYIEEVRQEPAFLDIILKLKPEERLIFEEDIKNLILELLMNYKKDLPWIESFSIGYSERSIEKNAQLFKLFNIYRYELHIMRETLTEAGLEDEINSNIFEFISLIELYKKEFPNLEYDADINVFINNKMCRDINFLLPLISSFKETKEDNPDAKINDVFINLLNSEFDLNLIQEIFVFFNSSIKEDQHFNQIIINKPELLKLLYNGSRYIKDTKFPKIISSLSKETLNNPNLKDQINSIVDELLSNTAFINENKVLILSILLDVKNISPEKIKKIKKYFDAILNSQDQSREGGYYSVKYSIEKFAYLINTLNIREILGDAYLTERIQPISQEIREYVQGNVEQAGISNFNSGININEIMDFIDAVGKENQTSLLEYLRENILTVVDALTLDLETINRAINLFEFDIEKTIILKLSLKFADVKDPSVLSIKSELIKLALQDENPEKKIDELLKIFTTEELPFFAKRFLGFRIIYSDAKLQRKSFIRQSFDQGRIGKENRSEKLDSDKINFGFEAVRYTIFLDLLRTSLESGENSLLEFLSILNEGISIIEQIKINGIENLNQNQLLVLNKCLFLCNLLIQESPFIKKEIKNSIPQVSLETTDTQEVQKILNSFNQLLKISENGNLINHISRYYLRPLGYSSIEEALTKARKVKSEADQRNREMIRSGFHLEEGDMMKSINGSTIQLILGSGFYGQEVLGNESDMTPMDHDLGEVTKEASERPIGEAYRLNAASTNFRGRGNPEDDLVVIIKPGQKYKRIAAAKPEEKYRYDSQIYEVIDRNDTSHSNHVGIRTSSPATDISAILMPSVLKEVSLRFENPSDYETAFIFYQVSNNGYYIPFINGNGEVVFKEEDYERYRVRKEEINSILESDTINIPQLLNLFSTNTFIGHLMELDAGVSEGVSIKEHTEMVLGIFENYFSSSINFSFISRDDIRTLLLFHDIGKGWSKAVTGSTHAQHEYTNKVLAQALNSIDTDPRKISLFLDIIDQDLIGDLIKNAKSAQEVAKEITKFAQRHSLQPRELLDFLTIFYSSDAGAYTSNAGSKGGNLNGVFNLSDMSLSEQNSQKIEQLRNLL